MLVLLEELPEQIVDISRIFLGTGSVILGFAFGLSLAFRLRLCVRIRAEGHVDGLLHILAVFQSLYRYRYRGARLVVLHQSGKLFCGADGLSVELGDDIVHQDACLLCRRGPAVFIVVAYHQNAYRHLQNVCILLGNGVHIHAQASLLALRDFLLGLCV